MEPFTPRFPILTTEARQRRWVETRQVLGNRPKIDVRPTSGDLSAFPGQVRPGSSDWAGTGWNPDPHEFASRSLSAGPVLSLRPERERTDHEQIATTGQ
jgi:hypothetical protein